VYKFLVGEVRQVFDEVEDYFVAKVLAIAGDVAGDAQQQQRRAPRSLTAIVAVEEEEDEEARLKSNPYPLDYPNLENGTAEGEEEWENDFPDDLHLYGLNFFLSNTKYLHHASHISLLISHTLTYLISLLELSVEDKTIVLCRPRARCHVVGFEQVFTEWECGEN
jgi:hypothetical protein